MLALAIWRIGAYDELAYIWQIDYGKSAYGGRHITEKQRMFYFVRHLRQFVRVVVDQRS